MEEAILKLCPQAVDTLIASECAGASRPVSAPTSAYQKLQIVFATHSPTMAAGLPPEGIAVFIPDGAQYSIATNVHCTTAFDVIGSPVERPKLIVEDALAKLMVDKTHVDRSNQHQACFLGRAPARRGERHLQTFRRLLRGTPNATHCFLTVIRGPQRTT